MLEREFHVPETHITQLEGRSSYKHKINNAYLNISVLEVAKPVRPATLVMIKYFLHTHTRREREREREREKRKREREERAY